MPGLRSDWGDQESYILRYYDQAGLMVRLDAENWMKCGTEFFAGRRHASVVLTRDFSDWSTMPDLSDTAEIWWRAVRKKDSIETRCSIDGQNFTSVKGILCLE